MQQLNLSYNQSGEGKVKNIELICDSLKSNKKLLQLDLSKNGLGEMSNFSEKKSNTDYFEVLRNGRKYRN